MTLAKLLPWTWVKKITRIKRSSDAYIFQFDIAGFDPKDIHITVSGNALMVHGEKKYDREKIGWRSYRRERRFGAFYRVLPIPDGVDVNALEATYSKRILTIRIPKLPAARLRRRRSIPITVEA